MEMAFMVKVQVILKGKNIHFIMLQIIPEKLCF